MCVIVVNELQTPEANETPVSQAERSQVCQPAVKSSNESIHLQTAFEEVTGENIPE